MTGSSCKYSPNERLLRKRMAARLRQRRCRERKREAMMVVGKCDSKTVPIKKRSTMTRHDTSFSVAKPVSPLYCSSSPSPPTTHYSVPGHIFRPMGASLSQPPPYGVQPPPPLIPLHPHVLPHPTHIPMNAHYHIPQAMVPVLSHHRSHPPPQIHHCHPHSSHHHHPPMPVPSNYHHRIPNRAPPPITMVGPRCVSRTASEETTVSVVDLPYRSTTVVVAPAATRAADADYMLVQGGAVHQRHGCSKPTLTKRSSKKNKNSLLTEEKAAVDAMLSLKTTSSSDEDEEDGTVATAATTNSSSTPSYPNSPESTLTTTIASATVVLEV